MSGTLKIGCLGFGEAGAAFAAGWAASSVQIFAYDVKTRTDLTRTEMLARYEALGVTGCENPDELVDCCDAVFSLVTADQAHDAARSVVGLAHPGILFFDCNSCAPHTKIESAALIENNGGKYVDVAVMAPVHPALHKTKVHISGPHSIEANRFMSDLGMNVTVIEGDVGVASAVKMVRSIMMKGLEATMLECVLAGRKAGVDDLVLDSLDKTYPGFNFREKAAYMMERVMVHGIRRAAELREVAITVDHLGIDNAMSRSTVEWQQKIGEMKLDPDYSLTADDYGPRADRLLQALETSGRKS